MGYAGFAKLQGQLAQEPGVKDPGAVAASIGKKKYGKKPFQKHAAEGASMKGLKAAAKG